MSERAFNVLQVFAGIGGGCLGFDRARVEYRGVRARFETIGAIDVDPQACADLEYLTGCKATCLDLFTREQYEAFHGHPPPEGWAEVVPADMRGVTSGRRPDVVFGSPPCKGLTALVAEDLSQTARYRALNQLVTRWLFLVLEAWRHDPPGLVLLENVPRIQTRGRALLDRVQAMLASYGYACAETVHDCGELGGLGQTRKRFLLVARHIGTVPAVVYEPQRFALRSIGDVIGGLPMPEDPAAGPMHTLPRLRWRTWLRLALIRAGKDWRDLAARWAPDRWGVVPAASSGRFNNVFRLVDWCQPSQAITGGAGPSSGGLSVADPRNEKRWHRGAMGVRDLAETIGTVTGRSVPTCGAFSIADPSLPGARGRHSTKFRVQDHAAPAKTVTGTMDVQAGAQSVADPRLGYKSRDGIMGVMKPSRPALTVTGSADVHQGTTAVADDRVEALGAGDWPAELDRRSRREPLVIISDDGTWHRPISTLEMAALQSFPTQVGGAPLVLGGGSSSRARMGIGNAVPPDAGQAIGEQFLITLVVSKLFGGFHLGSTGLWVRETGVLRWHPTSDGSRSGASMVAHEAT